MANQKLFLSNSSIQMFKSCKRKFKYRYIDRIPNPEPAAPNKYLSFGQSIHKALAKFNLIEDDKWRTLDILHNLFRSVWIREGYENRDEERNFGLRGLDILANYFNNQLDKGSKVLLVERMIKKDMGDFFLCGVIDKGFVSVDNYLEVTDQGNKNTVILNLKINKPYHYNLFLFYQHKRIHMISIWKHFSKNVIELSKFNLINR